MRINPAQRLSKAVFSTSASILLAIAVSGCSSSGFSSKSSDPISTGSIATPSLKATVVARNDWQKDPKNLRKGMTYVRQLQALEQKAEQLRVLEQLIVYHPDNTKLLTFYGKRLINSGQLPQAIRILRKAEARGERDWRLYSALGSALDQTGQYSKARIEYQKALALQPKEIKIQNNLAMSYALEGQLPRAEKILRRASETPRGRANTRIRQNLALVVGLQGRFDEARLIASRDLPPKEVEANMAYLRAMLAKPNTWNKLKKAS